MAYQVIARRWRPKQFEQLVGQSHVSHTLLNALKNDRLHHALLFTGPRGTGKTSSARILAMALRCPDDLDGSSQEAQDIAAGRSVDVIEIDGASNNGVDAIRDLRESVGYMPSSGTHKVYIIDEVHMLSTAAFNALLKTLEEPPDHVIFVMATTEVQKIPNTILSRCQRFDFRRISVRLITDHLEKVCKEDGVIASRDALWTIAKEGDGSMRDALSLLDQVITFSNGDITLEATSEILGLTNRFLLGEAFSAIAARDTDKTFEVVKKLFETGSDSKTFARDFLEQIRNALFLKTAPQVNNEVLDISDSEAGSLKEISSQLSEEDLHFLFDMMLKGLNDLSYASDPRIVLEMLLLRMATAPRITPLKNLVFSEQSHPPEAAQVAEPRSVSEKKKFSECSKSKVKPQNPGQSQFNSSEVTGSLHGHEINKSSLLASVQNSQLGCGHAQQKSQMQQLHASPTVANTEVKPSEPEVPQRQPDGAVTSGGGGLTYSTDKSPQENWFRLVQEIKRNNGLIGAQLENVFLSKKEEKTLHVGIPKPMKFIYEKMASSHFQDKALNIVNSYWGEGHSFHVFVEEDLTNKKAASQQMTPKRALEAQRREKKEELRKMTMAHPLVQAIDKEFEFEIISIKEKKS